ncbi:hypothetical protein U1Q18_024118 [Sarracenia purpurea var. burkii]
MTSSRRLEVRSDDQSPHKWCVPMTESAFGTLIAKANPSVHALFGEGSMFSPLLFGKFFDPSDAFPLWEFESEVLLSKLRSSGQSSVDWFQTDDDYCVKADLPGVGKSSVQVYVEQGKVVEISGQWKAPKEPNPKDWRSGHWWEHGYVRRLELPENADWTRMEAWVKNDAVLEIRIPKKSYSDCEESEGNDHRAAEETRCI